MSIQMVTGNSLAKERAAFIVGIDDIPRVWPNVVGMLSDLSNVFEAHHTYEDVLSRLLQGKYQLWLSLSNEGVDLIVITFVEDTPSGRVLKILWASGKDLNINLELFLDGVEVWAMEHQVVRAEIEGRPGLEKGLSKFGYKKERVVLVKNLVRARGH